MVGIYSRNCPEWVIAEQVCLANIERALWSLKGGVFHLFEGDMTFVQGLYCYSMVNVPLYDSLGPEARGFVISECEMRIVVAFDEVTFCDKTVQFLKSEKRSPICEAS